MMFQQNQLIGDQKSIQKLSLHSESLREILSKTNFTELKNDQDQSIILAPLSNSKTSIEGIQFKVKRNYLMTSYENHKIIIIAFACSQKHPSLQKKTKIILWQFKKKDGQNQTIEIQGIKGVVSSMRIDNIKFIQEKIQDESEKDGKAKYSICLIIGTVQGYLKRIYLRKDYSIKSVKLSTLNPIRQILPIDSQLWQENVFYFVLLNNNQIMLVNILNFDIICKFHPPILYCKAQYALNISLSQLQSNLLFQATKGGYLIVWDLSHPKLQQNFKSSLYNEFKRKNVLEMVFPKYLSHQLSLNGLLFMQTFGKLILIVDKKCTLKLFSIDLEDRTDFIKILQIQLPYSTDLTNQIQLQNSEPLQTDKQYEQNFESTYQNFKFSLTQMALYFMLQKEKHSVYKLKLNQYMECQSLERLKIRNKSLKQIEQFIISEDKQFLIVRKKDSFVIKYFGENDQVKSQQEQNQKDDYNKQRSKSKIDKKTQRSQKKDRQ